MAKILLFGKVCIGAKNNIPRGFENVEALRLTRQSTRISKGVWFGPVNAYMSVSRYYSMYLVVVPIVG